jgi:hypothetical protein
MVRDTNLSLLVMQENDISTPTLHAKCRANGGGQEKPKENKRPPPNRSNQRWNTEKKSLIENRRDRSEMST